MISCFLLVRRRAQYGATALMKGGQLYNVQNCAISFLKVGQMGRDGEGQKRDVFVTSDLTYFTLINILLGIPIVLKGIVLPDIVFYIYLFEGQRKLRRYGTVSRTAYSFEILVKLVV